MIGKYARGFQHLYKCVENSNTTQILYYGVTNYFTAMAFCGTRNEDEKVLLCFNNVCGDYSLPKNLTFSDTTKEAIKQIFGSKYCYCLIIDQRSCALGEYIILPDDFDDQLTKCIQQNKKVLESLVGRCGCDAFYDKYLFSITNGSPHLMAWGLTNLMKYHVSLTSLKHAIMWCQNYSQLVKNLKKGTPTAYNGKSALQTLLNEMVGLRKVKRANVVINMFNTQQKKLLKEVKLDDVIMETFSKFAILSNVKKSNFIRKMSTVTDASEIIHQMKLLTNIHFEWNKPSVYDFINNNENINCEVVYETENVLIVKVGDYETVKHLAKTTNWCISKNKKFWNDYIENYSGDNTQYVLFDFSKKEDDELSIVGFTASRHRGILHAHSFSNVNLMGERNAYPHIKRFVQNQLNIFNVLTSVQATEEMFCPMPKLKYEWNRNSFLEFLDYCIPHEDYAILLDENNIVVVETSSQMGRFLVGGHWKIEGSSSVSKYVLCFNFNRGENDIKKILYTTILCSHKTKEEFPCALYNATNRQQVDMNFNMLLHEVGLPYTTICRTDDPTHMIWDALSIYDCKTLDKLLSDKERVNQIKKMFKTSSKQTMSDLQMLISASVLEMRTKDIINVIYKNGLTLTELLGASSVDILLSNILYETCRFGRRFTCVPSEEDVLKLYSPNNGFTFEKTNYVGFYDVLTTILSHETDINCVGKNLTSMLYETQRTPHLSVVLVNKVMPFIINNPNLMKNIARLVINTNNYEAAQMMVANNAPDNVVSALSEILVNANVKSC